MLRKVFRSPLCTATSKLWMVWRTWSSGEVGDKKVYDPRSYLKKAEASMTERVIEACNDLHCAGKSVGV